MMAAKIKSGTMQAATRIPRCVRSGLDLRGSLTLSTSRSRHAFPGGIAGSRWHRSTSNSFTRHGHVQP